jgi:acyl-CoA thioester hydrolase
MQIVNNTVYVKWFEDLRTAILDEYFPLEEMLRDNNSPILAETHVKYIRPLTLSNKPTGKAWIDELGKSRWTARFEIEENGTLYCEGHQVGYYFNMKEMRPVRFPEQLLTRFENWETSL